MPSVARARRADTRIARKLTAILLVSCATFAGCGDAEPRHLVTIDPTLPTSDETQYPPQDPTLVPPPPPIGAMPEGGTTQDAALLDAALLDATPDALDDASQAAGDADPHD